MTVVSLPLQFQNSFWSQDYRKGLEVLYSKLEQGVVENEEIVAFIRARAAAEAAMAAALTVKTPDGAFDTDDGLSLHIAVRGLKEESIAQGNAHQAIATDLQTKIAEPFEAWATGYRDRLFTSRSSIVDGYLRSYEHAQFEVAELRNDYFTKTRKADEAEDDARFAPITQPAGDKYTTSPNLGPRDKRTPSRQPTMSERISQRLKDFRINAAQPNLADAKTAEVTFDAGVDPEDKPKVDKGKGRAIDPASPPLLASPPPLSPQLPPARLTTTDLPPPGPPIEVAGVAFSPTELSTLMAKAKGELHLRPVRFNLLGEYPEAFTGEEFTVWLKDNVKGFEGNLDRAEDAAKFLTEKLGVLRRLGEFGNEYVNADDAWYQFRAKAFHLEAPKNKEDVVSPLQKNLSPLADNVAKRTTTFANLVSKALNANTGEPVHVRARRDAEAADQEYRVAVRRLDRQRLGLEERIEDVLKTLQKWELDRLRAVKTVMSQYHACVEGYPKAVAASFERSGTWVASYQPEADLRALIEQYRTGPFRPEAQVYESVAHDESDVVFGIDLRKWADLGTWNSAAGTAEEKKEPKDLVPPVLSALLTAMREAYPSLPNDDERRKTWIYEVPLPAVHHLRETLNAVPPEQPIPDDALSKYDPPVLAGAIKLWALELDPPLCLYEGWDEFRKLYPSVGSVKSEVQPTEEQHIQELQNALQKLPMVHLVVLDTIVNHLKILKDSTSESDETDEVYVTKLALSIGRAILRPKAETKFSIQDRHPTLLFMDLINKYDEILPPTLAKKKRESQRKVPVRRRTRPMDMRMSRSRISAGMDLKEVHAQQLAQRMGKPMSPPSSVASPTTVIEEPENISDTQIHVTAEPDDITISDYRAPPPPASPTVPPPPPSFASIPPPPPVVSPSSSPVVPPPPSFANIPPPPPITQAATKPKSPSPPPPPPGVPSFKEPPPEDDEDDLPPRPPTFKEPNLDDVPRPSFKEPAPDSDDGDLPMPKFSEPPSEPPTPRANTSSSPTPSNAATPTSLSRATSPKRQSRAGSVSSRSASPNKAEATSTAARNGSLQRASRLGGPRVAAGGGGSGNVGNLVKTLNRNSMGSSPPGNGIQRPGSPATGANARTTTHAKRSSASRASAFERRTMASDAEEEIVQ